MSSSKKLHSLLVSLPIAIVSTLPWLLWRDAIQEHAALGYSGLFLACFVINAVVLLPVSSTLCVVTASSVLNPVVCILTATLGAALGEACSYLCGLLGARSVREPDWLNRFILWLEKHAFLCVLICAALPLPFFDIVGIAAGVRRIPFWKYLSAAAMGKFIKYAAIVAASLLLLPWMAEHSTGYFQNFFTLFADMIKPS